MTTLSNSIESLESALNEVLESHKHLNEENLKIKDQLMSAEQTIKERSKEVEELKEKLKVISLAKRFDGEESDDKKELKLKINEMMRELDKCIAVLKA